MAARAQKNKKLEDIYKEAETLVSRLYGGERLFVRGEGDPDADVLIIGEAPKIQDTIMKKPFVGGLGRHLNELLNICRLNREDIYITNVCKFRPCRINKKGRISNRPPNKEEMGLFIPFLEKEINTIKPKIIITLGNTALRAILGDNSGIAGKHGKPEEIKILKKIYTIYPLYHPASIAFNAELRKQYYEDAHELSKYLSIIVSAKILLTEK